MNIKQLEQMRKELAVVRKTLVSEYNDNVRIHTLLSNLEEEVIVFLMEKVWQQYLLEAEGQNESSFMSRTPQAPDIKQLDQILDHVRSTEKIIEEMMITSAVENTIVTHLSEFKESVLSSLKLLVWHQYQALKEAEC